MADIRSKNEEGLMQLNGFLDLAESRSTQTTGRMPSSQSEYSFEFLTATPGTSAPDDPIQKVSATIKVPKPLIPAATSPELRKEWAILSARIASELLEKASMEVPKELLEASAKSLTGVGAHPSTAVHNKHGDLSKHRPAHRGRSRKHALSREEIVKMTLENVRHHEDFELVEDSDGFSGFRPVSEMSGRKKRRHMQSGTSTSSHAVSEAKDREALVGKIFNSKRVSVSAKMQDRPEEVMKGAAELQSFLMKHCRDLELHEPRWSSVIFMLTPPEDVDAANDAAQGTADQSGTMHVVHVPCPVFQVNHSDNDSSKAKFASAASKGSSHLVQKLRRIVFGKE